MFGLVLFFLLTKREEKSQPTRIGSKPSKKTEAPKSETQKKATAMREREFAAQRILSVYALLFLDSAINELQVDNSDYCFFRG